MAPRTGPSVENFRGCTIPALVCWLPMSLHAAERDQPPLGWHR
jgi:hypothetical protein